MKLYILDKDNDLSRFSLVYLIKKNMHLMGINQDISKIYGIHRQ